MSPEREGDVGVLVLCAAAFVVGISIAGIIKLLMPSDRCVDIAKMTGNRPIFATIVPSIKEAGKVDCLTMGLSGKMRNTDLCRQMEWSTPEPYEGVPAQ